MKKRLIAILLAFAMLGIVSLAVAFQMGGTLILYATQWTDELPEVVVDDPSVISVVGITPVSVEPTSGHPLVEIELKGHHSGRTWIHIGNEAAGQGQRHLIVVRGMHNMIFERSRVTFTGSRWVALAGLCFLLILAGLLWKHAWFRCRTCFYAARTVLVFGMAIFVTGMTLIFGFACLLYLPNPRSEILGLWDLFSQAGYYFLLCTSPVLIVLAVAVALSNVALVRHEGMRLRNLLGIMTLLVLSVGLTLIVTFDDRFFTGSLTDYKIHSAMTSVYTTCVVFLESMLFGAILAALLAAGNEPKTDRDYVIICGCQISKDGKLLPLLRGRVDRALAFARKQEASGGKPVVFVPAGGQGPDECRSEASAMAEYLRDKGIAGDRILEEDRSVSTYENMLNARRLIEQRSGGKAKIAFSTTNYHVFRSGIMAIHAGMRAEGMGSPTKWYYWPNAFLREFVALLVAEWRLIVPALLLLILFFGGLALTTI
ncbi:MAG: YdcF family protein [Clostridia bacterium]|nr:YdcF family protein [Clostridia bacterium]